ncbi:MAG: DUF1911 domain-containing protein [Lachnospiraceae bacterium]|nr:DUF1911 domain-containing protein [Lachnospiraceae bacterium]
MCGIESLKETIAFNESEIKNKMDKIDALCIDIENRVQRFPKKNEDIIYSTKVRVFQLLYEAIRASYSLGMDCKELEKYYEKLIPIIQDIGWGKIGYVHFIQVFALGILLEVSDEKLNKLVITADKEDLDDCLFDFLVQSCGLTRKKFSKMYQKENPYKYTAAIINSSAESKKKAEKELADYMKKKWFQGHFDYEWKNAHKQPGYVGFWSFETAALAKILGLEDAALEKNNHYPYDLAHYKNGKVFSVGNTVVDANEAVGESEPEIEIEQNRELHEVVPNQFRNLVNQVIMDYGNLDDAEFWGKYQLENVWYTVDEFSKENAEKKLLGAIIVNILVEKDYILQLDYKEDIEEYAANMKNYWGSVPVKMISFDLNNDQYYYAIVPKEVQLDKLYEIFVTEERIIVG